MPAGFTFKKALKKSQEETFQALHFYGACACRYEKWEKLREQVLELEALEEEQKQKLMQLQAAGIKTINSRAIVSLQPAKRMHAQLQLGKYRFALPACDCQSDHACAVAELSKWSPALERTKELFGR